MGCGPGIPGASVELSGQRLPAAKDTGYHPSSCLTLQKYTHGVGGCQYSPRCRGFRWQFRGNFSLDQRRKRKCGGSTLASLLPSLFNTMMLVIVSIFGLVHLIMVHSLTQIQLIGFSIILVFMALVFGASILASHYRQYASSTALWAAGHLALLRHKPFDPASTQKEMDNLFMAWDELWRGEWQLLTLGAFVNVLFDMLTLYFLFIASGNNISFGVLLAGYALPLLLGKIAFILPGGVGVVETSMAALYNALGIPNATTVVVVLGYRLISFWIPSLIGFPTAAYLQRSHNRPEVISTAK
jgi:uncharacterized protein (TIRG00374 family)